jgi:gamma-glutamylcyclotransferase (GGCT)/AIG2-like uncharacterized protein YtfP
MMLNKFFVYGTLRPDEARWQQLAPYAQKMTPALLRGAQLYSTGPWPFVTVDDNLDKYEGEDAAIPSVVGELIEVNEPELVQAMLDRIEGYDARYPDDSLFIRWILPITIPDGHEPGIPSTDAAYVYVGGDSLKKQAQFYTHIPSGDWKQR